MHLTGPKANILINNSGHACLADFSFLTMASDQTTVITSCVEGGTIPWMSPELLDPEQFGLKKSCPTKESDCYALGMVVYEVLSGQTPFSPSIAFAVVRKVLEGERPVRPEGERGKLFTGAIWELLVLCWDHQPSGRVNAKAVLSCLEGNPSVWSPPNVDEHSGVGGGDQLDAPSRNSGVFSTSPCLTFDHPCGVLDPSPLWSLASAAGTFSISSIDPKLIH